MAELTAEARREFWSRPGTFGIVGSFEAPGKLSWMLLEQCQKDGVDAVPVNPDAGGSRHEGGGDQSQFASLAGIVCVRSTRSRPKPWRGRRAGRAGVARCARRVLSGRPPADRPTSFPTSAR
jgi:hypothetical protein